jgi:hypothetical protein
MAQIAPQRRPHYGSAPMPCCNCASR